MKQSTSGSSNSFRDFKPKPQRTSKTKKKTESKKRPTRPRNSPYKVPKRKPVWKIVGSSEEQATIDESTRSTLRGELDVNNRSTATEENDPSGAVRNGWYNQRYDPIFITGCNSCCRCGGEDRIAI